MTFAWILVASVEFLLLSFRALPSAAERDHDYEAYEAEGALVNTRSKVEEWQYGRHRAHSSIVPMPLPHSLRTRFRHAAFMRSGSFGEVWRAEDSQNGGRPVALKMFYTKDPANESHHIPLTKRNAMKADDNRIRSRLKYASRECSLAQHMQQYSEEDTIASSRLMRCFEDHILGSGNSRHTRDMDQPLYQVYEYCGSTSLGQWIKDNKDYAAKNPKGYVLKAMDVFVQVMRVLSYLNQYDTRWVHHDLKPENIMVNEGPDGRNYVKIIDFGSTTLATRANAKLSAVSSPAYAEPQWFDKVGSMLLDGRSWLRGYNADNPSSYDVYAAGAILDELITGVSTYEKFQDLAQNDAGSKVPGYMPEMCRRQRFFGRLSTRAKQDGDLVSLSSALKDLKETKDKDDALCTKWLRILRVKGDSGVERRMTSSWGVGSDWKQKYKNFQDAFEDFMTHRRAKPEYANAVSDYKALTRPTGWYATHMRMLALDPKNRPFPSEVLKEPVPNSITDLLPLRPAPDVRMHHHNDGAAMLEESSVERSFTMSQDAAQTVQEEGDVLSKRRFENVQSSAQLFNAIGDRARMLGAANKSDVDAEAAAAASFAGAVGAAENEAQHVRVHDTADAAVSEAADNVASANGDVAQSQLDEKADAASAFTRADQNQKADSASAFTRPLDVNSPAEFLEEASAEGDASAFRSAAELEEDQTNMGTFASADDHDHDLFESQIEPHE
eukprot:TRINITY_DN8870_c0_g2_i1.p1 TRINITY_DN8870_c0_g2~~TRINITY_DN8870_c0_g2_i1.p1  ORF type:complete len:763 (-),score=177.61 TRINITY_DN8870_c0_g2_i1:290-2464(-)